jgi:hypothetical protein
MKAKYTVTTRNVPEFMQHMPALANHEVVTYFESLVEAQKYAASVAGTVAPIPSER